MQADWSAPTATAPADNTAAPVNIGSTTQAKSGNLAANIFAATTEMRSDRYCDALGGDCVASSGIGGGSWGTWTNVAASRARRTWYQNNASTGRMVAYQFGTGGPGYAYVSPTGTSTNWVMVTSPDGDSGEWKPGSFVVPPGHYYYIDASAGINMWSELQLPI